MFIDIYSLCVIARLEAALESAMSLELGPRGLLVFEDYAKGNTSQRKGIPGRSEEKHFLNNLDYNMTQVEHPSAQCPRVPHCSARRRAQPPAPASPFTGESVVGIS